MTGRSTVVFGVPMRDLIRKTNTHNARTGVSRTYYLVGSRAFLRLSDFLEEFWAKGCGIIHGRMVGEWTTQEDIIGIVVATCRMSETQPCNRQLAVVLPEHEAEVRRILREVGSDLEPQPYLVSTVDM